MRDRAEAEEYHRSLWDRFVGVSGIDADALIPVAVTQAVTDMYVELQGCSADLYHLLDDTLTLMDQTASEEVQHEARCRIIERFGEPTIRTL